MYICVFDSVYLYLVVLAGFEVGFRVRVWGLDLGFSWVEYSGVYTYHFSLL